MTKYLQNIEYQVTVRYKRGPTSPRLVIRSGKGVPSFGLKRRCCSIGKFDGLKLVIPTLCQGYIYFDIKMSFFFRSRDFKGKIFDCK